MPQGKSTRPRGRFRRAFVLLGWILGVVVTLAASVVGGAVLHANLPASRRAIASQVGGLFASSLRGTITVERIGRIGVDGADGLTVRVLDPEGRTALFVDGLSARIAIVDLVRSVFGRGDIRVALRDVVIEFADVSLDTDGAGMPRVARAFEPTDAPPSTRPGRGLVLGIERARIEHAWVHGQIEGAPLLDCDVDRQVARIFVDSREARIDLDEAQVDTRAAPRGANLHGSGGAHLRLPSPSGARFALAAAFVGEVGSIPVRAEGWLDGERVDLVADVREASADEVRLIVPEAPIHRDLQLHAEAHGDLGRLAVSADATVGPGTAALEGDVVLGDEVRARVDVWARDVDVRAFSEGAPASSLGADLQARVVSSASGDLTGELDLDLKPGRLGGQLVPAASVRATFTGTSVRGVARVAEPGAPGRISFDVRPRGESTVARLDVSVVVPRLDAVPRAGPMARGRASLSLSGEMVFESRRLGSESPTPVGVDAQLRVDAAGISRGALRVERATLDARILGTLAAPVIGASLEARALVAGGMLFDRVTATATGPVTNLAVTAAVEAADGSRGDARARIQPGPPLTVRGARASVVRGGETAVATAETIRFARGRADIDRATLEGLGEPVRFSVHVTRDQAIVRAEAKDLDLARLARLVRSEGFVTAGHLAFDVDLDVHGRQAVGVFAFDLTGGSFRNVRADAHLDAKLMGRRVFGNLGVTMPGVGHLYVNTSTVHLGGPVLDSASWATAYGKGQIDAEADLARLAALLPAGSLPLGELRGKLTVEGELGRDDAREAPQLELSARTEGLTIAGAQEAASRVDGTSVVRPAGWRSVGVDVRFDAGVDAKTGRAHLEARAVDAHGVVAALETHAILPYEELVVHPGSAMARLESVPFEAKLWVPKRALGQLPPVLGTKGMLGTAELSATAAGTALEPRLSVVARTSLIKLAGSAAAVPSDTELRASYDGVAADAWLSIRAREGNVLDATARVNVRAKDILHPSAGGAPWDASGLVHLTRFPLHSVSRIAEMRVRGHISGEIGLADLHKDARAQAELRIDDVRVGRASYTGGFVRASLDGERLDASLRLEQTDGFAEAKAKLGTRWGTALGPTMDDDKPAELSLEAHDFRAAALLPFVEGTFSELDGRIDADARIDIGPRRRRLAMRGTAKLTRGIFEIPAMGDEFTDATATVVLLPDGVVRVQDVSARGTTGRVMASAVARLDGLDLSAAHASVRIPEGQPIPLSVEGQELGVVSGDIDFDLKITRDRKTVNVVVDVPKLLARIPETRGHSLQALAGDPTIRVGVRRVPGQLTLVPLGPPRPVGRPRDALTWNVQLRLGKDVEVRRGTTMRVQLDGSPTLSVADGTRVTGQIRIRGGVLDVQGKKFEIDKGTITFTGDADNPIVVVTAGWTAPDGTQVYADFVGPLKTGKVTLRSEPSLPRNEILSLILFGTQGGSQAAAPGQGPAGPTRAVGLGGGVATEGLNRAMEDLTGLDLTARVDTSDSANPRPELEFQIAKNISLQIAYVLGVPPPGQNPDKSLLTLDWRFYRNFSLETTVGDRGSSILDLVWRKRY